jgi:nucleosome binding factor SPN SPT16 subunit
MLESGKCGAFTLLLQDWLTSIEIKYYESKVNLNWKNILKSIKEVRPQGFAVSGAVAWLVQLSVQPSW